MRLRDSQPCLPPGALKWLRGVEDFEDCRSASSKRLLKSWLDVWEAGNVSSNGESSSPTFLRSLSDFDFAGTWPDTNAHCVLQWHGAHHISHVHRLCTQQTCECIITLGRAALTAAKIPLKVFAHPLPRSISIFYAPDSVLSRLGRRSGSHLSCPVSYFYECCQTLGPRNSCIPVLSCHSSPKLN